MKKVPLLIALSLLVTNTFAQRSKGDRVLAWQVDMAQNNNYDSAYAYAQTGCMESIHLFYTWSGIEPTAGTFDASFISNTLDIANIYYPIHGTKAELQIAPMNTNVKETPADLLTTSFDDPVMISRFKTVLDTIFQHIPDLELSALNIGNECDIYMGTDASQYIAFKTFLDAVIPYAKQLYFDLHETELKVGTTFTFDGLSSASTTSLCQTVNNGLDIVSLTYYPLNPDFTMESPSTVSGDFASLVALYSDTLQPIYFAECGYASSPVCNSSEVIQAQFYQHVFSAWDTHYDNIKYLTIFKTTDWSPAEVSDLGTYYGITDITFLEFLRSLGVRTWDNDGTNKLAYETVLCELNERGWCSVNCATTGTNDLNEKTSVLIYPTIGNTVLTIDTEAAIQIVMLYNSAGKLCFSTTTKTVKIDDLSDGIYFVTVLLDSGELHQKKVIKH